jgi:phage FluMu protein Com
VNDHYCRYCQYWVLKTPLTSGWVQVKCKRCRREQRIYLDAKSAPLPTHIEAAGLR